MNEIYFLIIQPDDFEFSKKVERVILRDYHFNVVIDDDYSEFVKEFIVDLCNKNVVFITYNGYLLENMLEMFFGVSYYKNIINLMEDFARVKGDYNKEFESYTWSKLQTALNWYADKSVSVHLIKVDINNANSVLYATYYLYEAMQKYDEKQIIEEIEKGAI